MQVVEGSSKSEEWHYRCNFVEDEEGRDMGYGCDS